MRQEFDNFFKNFYIQPFVFSCCFNAVFGVEWSKAILQRLFSSRMIISMIAFRCGIFSSLSHFRGTLLLYCLILERLMISYNNYENTLEIETNC